MFVPDNTPRRANSLQSNNAICNADQRPGGQLISTRWQRPGLITKHASPCALKGQINPYSFLENIYANNLKIILLNCLREKHFFISSPHFLITL